MAGQTQSAVENRPPYSSGSLTADPLDHFQVLQHLPVGVTVFSTEDDHNFRLILANQQARSLLSGTRNQLPIDGARASDLAAFQLSGSPISRLKMALHSRHPVTFDWLLPLEDRDQYYRCQFAELPQQGPMRHILCTFIDRTAEKRAERNLLHRALHDPLTGLPNRSLFLEILQEIVEESNKQSLRHCGIIIINVDRFQLVNESFGHKNGDKFLIQLAGRLRQSIGPNDVLARLNGDEFAVLCDHIGSIEHMVQLAERIHDSMRQPFAITQEEEVYLSVCIGVASTFSSTIHAEHLIRDADHAMHKAKSTANGRTELFHTDTLRHSHGVFQMETALRRALEAEQLELYFQPIIDLESGLVTGLEALTRWNDPEKGFISPSDFIPLAEETGLIVPLGRWALKMACQKVKHLRQLCPAAKGLVMNVNVSGVQFTRDNVIEAVREALDFADVPGEALRIEITESAIMDNPELAAEILYELKTYGVTLALDDFGTGYSSLNYLHRFPIDCLKIDRSFVSQLDEDNEKAKIVNIINNLAENFGLSVVAEGIEDQSQSDLLYSLGCRYAQGFFYARPTKGQQLDEIILAFQSKQRNFNVKTPK